MDWIDGLSTAWRREYPDHDVAVLPPMVRLARLAILIETFQNEVVAPFDLSAADYSVLAALRRGGKPYALTPGKLYSRLQRSSGGMTKMVKRLEERGLVRRSPDPKDGRGSLVSLTRRGLATQERIFNAFLCASDDVLGPLGRVRVREADRALRDFLDVFETYFDAHGEDTV